tara:strand:+ start:416 stop:565 length:150 start_codon:yes stop_codon:yes gene_type:complete
MIKPILWISFGIMLYHFGVITSMVNFIATSDLIDITIEFLEGLKPSEKG